MEVIKDMRVNFLSYKPKWIAEAALQNLQDDEPFLETVADLHGIVQDDMKYLKTLMILEDLVRYTNKLKYCINRDDLFTEIHNEISDFSEEDIKTAQEYAIPIIRHFEEKDIENPGPSCISLYDYTTDESEIRFSGSLTVKQAKETIAPNVIRDLYKYEDTQVISVQELLAHALDHHKDLFITLVNRLTFNDDRQYTVQSEHFTAHIPVINELVNGAVYIVDGKNILRRCTTFINGFRYGADSQVQYTTGSIEFCSVETDNYYAGKQDGFATHKSVTPGDMEEVESLYKDGKIFYTKYVNSASDMDNKCNVTVTYLKNGDYHHHCIIWDEAGLVVHDLAKVCPKNEEFVID